MVKQQQEISGQIKVIPLELQLIVDEFQINSGNESENSLPLSRAIDHRIDLVPGASMPNLPHYKLSRKEVDILQAQMEKLLLEG